MLLSWQRKESSTCKRCLPSQGDILSFLPPPNCETSSASHLNNKGKCGNAVVTCNLFYVHSTVGSSHQRSKKKTPNQPTIGPDFKRANIHLPPAVCSLQWRSCSEPGWGLLHKSSLQSWRKGVCSIVKYKCNFSVAKSFVGFYVTLFGWIRTKRPILQTLLLMESFMHMHQFESPW